MLIFFHESRREFLKKALLGGVMLSFRPEVQAGNPPVNRLASNIRCTLYRSTNGSTAENIVKVIEMIGGIEKFIGSEDVVVIKPNVQWWNQGAPNLSALKTFVDLIMNQPKGFNGEVVIAENCHRGKNPWTSVNSGWAHHFDLNSDLTNVKNFNDLCGLLKKRYTSRFSIVHWINVGSGGRRVFSPADGVGYVYCDGTGGVPLLKCNNCLSGTHSRETIMTYPIFSTDRGTIVDFKYGIWEKRSYTEQPLRFINFAALNHHGTYCGATSAIKNYLGISDLSGGPDPYNGGCLTKDYYNFHSFPFDEWSHGPVPGMLGAEIGVFLKTIREADLNIVTAEWVGLSSRTDPPVAHTRAVLACTDPVALDYHATKYILFPNSGLSIHDPDDKKSPLHHYLAKCAELSSGVFDERYVGIKSYDFKTQALQKDTDLVIIGDKKWGNNIKHILKYLVLRFLAKNY